MSIIYIFRSKHNHTWLWALNEGAMGHQIDKNLSIDDYIFILSARFICKNTTFLLNKLFSRMNFKIWLFLGPQNFRLDVRVSRSLLWLTYTCDLAPKGLKICVIARQWSPEIFVMIQKTVWEIWPKTLRGGPYAPPVRIKRF